MGWTGGMGWKGMLAAGAVAALSGCVVAPHWPARIGVVVYRSQPGTRVAMRSRAVTFSAFYEALAPDGQWLVLPGYGYVWRPHPWVVGEDFRPYSTGGTWTWTDAGWQFNAEWSWSWATFHYGRWLRDGASGWVWVPGSIWAPAWVEWRLTDGYVGWAPLGPPGVAVAATGSGWSFVEGPYFGHPRIERYYLPPDQVVSLHARVHAVSAPPPGRADEARGTGGSGPPHGASPARPRKIR